MAPSGARGRRRHRESRSVVPQDFGQKSFPATVVASAAATRGRPRDNVVESLHELVIVLARPTGRCTPLRSCDVLQGADAFKDVE